MNREKAVLAVLQSKASDGLKLKAIEQLFGSDYCGDFISDYLNEKVSVKTEDEKIVIEVSGVERGVRRCVVEKKVYTSIVANWHDVPKRVE